MADMGSLVVTDWDGNRKTFEGLQSDFSKLPTNDPELGTGSQAVLYSSSGVRVYGYEKTTKTWYEM